MRRKWGRCFDADQPTDLLRLLRPKTSRRLQLERPYSAALRPPSRTWTEHHIDALRSSPSVAKHVHRPLGRSLVHFFPAGRYIPPPSLTGIAIEPGKFTPWVRGPRCTQRVVMACGDKVDGINGESGDSGAGGAGLSCCTQTGVRSTFASTTSSSTGMRGCHSGRR